MDQTSPEVSMAEPSTKFNKRSSSSSSGELSVTVVKEDDISTAGAGADVGSREEAVGGSASNGVTNSSGLFSFVDFSSRIYKQASEQTTAML